MSGIKLLTELDLRLEFKNNTGHYVELDSLIDSEKQYVMDLEEKLLAYRNTELVVEQANIDANTVKIEEESLREPCVGCESCSCDE